MCQTYQIVYFKHVHFLVCQLYLNKAFKNQTKKNRKSLIDLWDNIKSPNLHVIVVIEEKRGNEEGAEKYLSI